MGDTVDSDDELLALLHDSLDDDVNASPAPQQSQACPTVAVKTAESEQERKERKAQKLKRREQRRQRREAKMAAKEKAPDNNKSPNEGQASGTPAVSGHGAAVWVNPTSASGRSGATGSTTGNKRHFANMSSAAASRSKIAMQIGGAKNATRGSKAKVDLSLDPHSGLRLRNRLISGSDLDAHMKGRLCVRLPKLPATPVARLEDPNIDWVTFGVVVHKSATKVSAKGGKYAIWKLSDLEEGNMTLFLFGDAYEAHWKESNGAVIAVLNARVLPPREGARSNERSLSVTEPGEVAKLGSAQDYGVCKGTRKDGTPCSMVVNKAKSPYCKYHAAAQLRAIDRSTRSELQSTRRRPSNRPGSAPGVTRGGFALPGRGGAVAAQNVIRQQQQQQQQLASTFRTRAGQEKLGRARAGFSGASQGLRFLSMAGEKKGAGTASAAAAAGAAAALANGTSTNVPARPKTAVAALTDRASANVHAKPKTGIDFMRSLSTAAIRRSTVSAVPPPKPPARVLSRVPLARTVVPSANTLLPGPVAKKPRAKSTKTAPVDVLGAALSGASRARKKCKVSSSGATGHTEDAVSRSYEPVRVPQESRLFAASPPRIGRIVSAAAASTQQQQLFVGQQEAEHVVSCSVDGDALREKQAFAQALKQTGQSKGIGARRGYNSGGVAQKYAQKMFEQASKPHARLILGGGSGANAGMGASGGNRTHHESASTGGSSFSEAFKDFAVDSLHSAQTKALLARKPNHAGEAEQAEGQHLDRVLGKLEQRDQLAQHVESVTQMEVKVFVCRQCNRKTESFPQLCREEGHEITCERAIKRFFECQGCKNRITTLAQKFPSVSCKKCGAAAWRAAGRRRQWKGPDLAEPLQPRGEEVSKSLREGAYSRA